MVFKGKISFIGEVKTGTSAKEWAVVEFVVTEEKNVFPQSAVFKLFKNGENVKFATDFAKYNKVGDTVEVEFNLSAKEWGGRYFQELGAWKVNNLSKGNGNESQAQSPQNDDSDIPF